MATGSGFVMRVDGETAYVVTNHHVVAMESSPLTLVFDGGTKGERSVNAAFVATDPSATWPS